MVKHSKKIALSLAAVLALAFGGTAIASSHSSHAGTVSGNVTATENPSGPDTDNIQSGDQSAPDTAASTTSSSTSSGEAPGTEQPASSEQPGTESGSEVPGNDGPGGHADEPGNANADHQVQGQE
jgi:hypothetical protein